MPDFDLFLRDDKNEAHVAEHGVTTDEFEYVVLHHDNVEISRSSGLPMVFGYTEEGRYLCCVFDTDGDFCIPVTAYDVSE